MENLTLESSTTHQPTTVTASPPSTSNPKAKTSTIAEIKANKELWYKLHVYIYDLRNFREGPSSKRLDSIVDASYIGLPYFTPQEVELLKSTRIPMSSLSGNNNWNPKVTKSKSQHRTSKAEDEEEEYKILEEVIEETLNESLERRLKKRVESGDFRVCAAHDLAPVFERAFGIKEKELARNERFKEVLGRWGLKLKEGEDEQWEEGGKVKIKGVKKGGKGKWLLYWVLHRQQPPLGKKFKQSNWEANDFINYKKMRQDGWINTIPHKSNKFSWKVHLFIDVGIFLPNA
jgi:hypothetical protein